MKPRFNLRLKPCSSSTTTPTPPSSKENKKYVRHLSLSHEKEVRKRSNQKKKLIEEAVAYCREQKCKGYKAVTDLELDLDPRTVNYHLEREYVRGEDQKILTNEEERSLVRYLILLAPKMQVKRPPICRSGLT